MGLADACARARDTIADHLDACCHAGLIVGYWAAFVGDEGQAEEKVVPPEVLDSTSGRFPFLYLRVNYHRLEDPEIAAVIRHCGFEEWSPELVDGALLD